MLLGSPAMKKLSSRITRNAMDFAPSKRAARRATALAFAGSLWLAACSSSDQTGNDPDSGSGDSGTPISSDAGTASDASSATTHTVIVDNFTYKPAALTVKVGDTVTWKFTTGTHSVTSGTDCTADGKVDSKVHTAPFEFSHTFTEQGRFDYFCSYREHCKMMKQAGAVTIE